MQREIEKDRKNDKKGKTWLAELWGKEPVYTTELNMI